MEINLWEEAKNDFSEALKYEPDSKQIRGSLIKSKKVIADYEAKERERYKNLFK